MDPILVLVLVLFIVLVLVAVFSRANRSGDGTARDSETELFTFEEDGVSAVPTTLRRTEIRVPAQSINGARRKLTVVAAPLPAMPNDAPPAEKGIEALVAMVINPVVRDAETNQELYEFDPPLEIAVRFKPEDTTETGDEPPRLSLITAYLAGQGWKFERLPTAVTSDGPGKGGTLRAQLRTLQPQDPLVIGRP